MAAASAVRRGGLRWGLLGSGKICADFATALRHVPGAELRAVAARSSTAAEAFQDTHAVPLSFGSYAELVASDEVDVCYVGMLNTSHKAATIACLEAGKHVLVEKPMALSVKDAKDMVDAAQSNKCFLMEGMWTRFFPAVRRARELIRDGYIGDVKQVQADFGFHCTDGPSSRMFNAQLGGGGLLDIGCYVVDAAAVAFDGLMLTDVVARGELGPTGVDHNGTLILSYEDKGFAALQYSLDVNTTEETTIYGTRGHIKLHSPAHCPERMTVVTHSDDSDHVPGPKIERFEFPLGPLAEGETYNYPNQSGFRYQIEAVQQCIQLGQLESPEYTHEQMMQNMAVLQMAMRQMNVNVVDQACQPPVALQNLCKTPLQQRTASMHA